MKRTLYIPFTVCILLFPACSGDLPEQQAGESRVLQLNFKQEGEATLVRTSNALTTENGAAAEIGLCITQGIGYEAYPGRTNTRYTFKTDGTGLYEGDGSNSTSTTFYLTGEDAHIQAFYPNSAVTKTNSDNGYTIPVEIPAEQTFTTTDGTSAPSTPSCVATDYLYGSASNNAGDITSITTNAMQASPTNIYLHHALAKVMFTLQCDANRTPNTEYDCVKSIEISASSSSTPFLTGTTGTMQINNGALDNLTEANKITLKPQGDPITIGTYNTPATVACGLVAPLNGTPGTVTLTITLGKKDDTDHDRTYTATSNAFNVQWKAGYCYTYNLVLGSKLTTTSDAVTWNNITLSTGIEAKERGISAAAELTAFRDQWNRDGLQFKTGSTEYDYTPYEPYGWYDQSNGGQFTIKLTADIVFNEASDSWTPIGIEDKPLTIPFDGQGWKVILQLQNNAMEIKNQTYSGFIGYAKTDIKNLSVVTDPQSGVISDAGKNKIESTGATYAGGLAGYVEGNIINCSIDLKGTDVSNSAPSTGTDCYIGGLVGCCKGNIYNSAAYTTPVNGNPASVTLIGGASGSCIGGLAGKVEGTSGASGTDNADVNVNNCYAHLDGLGYSTTGGDGSGLTSGDTSGATNEVPSGIKAGWLVGDNTAATFSNTYYMAGTATTVTTNDSQTGINAFTDWSALCTSLNETAATHKWASWQEEKNTSSDKTEKVILILRKGK
jgi:hypothetical protein